MSKPGTFKHDYEAVALWGPAYADIPKSVFAVVAWYLADISSEAGADNGQAQARFIEELKALRGNGILPAEQVARALSSLARWNKASQ